MKLKVFASKEYDKNGKAKWVEKLIRGVFEISNQYMQNDIYGDEGQLPPGTATVLSGRVNGKNYGDVWVRGDYEVVPLDPEEKESERKDIDSICEENLNRAKVEYEKTVADIERKRKIQMDYIDNDVCPPNNWRRK